MSRPVCTWERSPLPLLLSQSQKISTALLLFAKQESHIYFVELFSAGRVMSPCI